MNNVTSPISASASTSFQVQSQLKAQILVASSKYIYRWAVCVLFNVTTTKKTEKVVEVANCQRLKELLVATKQ